jgi:hypothetical protein
MGSPDENRLKSGPKRGTGGLTGPFFAVRMKKKWPWGALWGDEWRCSKIQITTKKDDASMQRFELSLNDMMSYSLETSLDSTSTIL